MLSFRSTPSVTVADNRGLAVRTIAYCRRPDELQATDERITHHQHDARGVLARSADPRLAAAGRANFTYLSDLAGTALRTRSVDAGTSITLRDAAGRPFMEVVQVATDEEGNDDLSQAITRTWQYEAPAQAGRPLSVTEQVADSEMRIAERFVWAQVTQQARDHNLLGQVTRRYDPAGLVQANSFTLTGVPISTTRQLLKDADHPDIAADWQGEEAAEWDTRLARETYTTQTTADATGVMLTTLDAAGNLQRVAYDVAGQLSGSWLTIAGKAEQAIVRSVSYSAAGQKLREVHGNGVVTTYTYEPDTQRLSSIKTERQGTGAKVLQDLRYAYDPVGNVLKIRNDAEATRFWRNQKVVPENTYSYDSLYQLASATGREMANAGQPGRNLHVTLFDSATYTQYTRTYHYDTAGNLLQIRHSAPATNNGYTTDITVSDRSNRAVLSSMTKAPSAVEALFTPGGQQAVLLPGQPLTWTSRAELEQVVSVKREGATDDRESYRYDSHSQRVLKASTQQTAQSTQAQRVIYLPGLELRIHTNGDTLTQDLQVMTVGEAGRAQVRVLHWQAGKPDDLPNDQLRYSYDNLLGSSALEVDGTGNLISQEEYYPFGGTAVWVARNEIEASYKIVRYSGKERDATGLYYYGYRYYQPWAGRWLSADPAGTVDGLNLFKMVGNNPSTLIDERGLTKKNTNRRPDHGQQRATPQQAVQQPATTNFRLPWRYALDYQKSLPTPHTAKTLYHIEQRTDTVRPTSLELGQPGQSRFRNATSTAGKQPDLQVPPVVVMRNGTDVSIPSDPVTAGGLLSRFAKTAMNSLIPGSRPMRPEEVPNRHGLALQIDSNSALETFTSAVAMVNNNLASNDANDISPTKREQYVQLTQAVQNGEISNATAFLSSSFGWVFDHNSPTEDRVIGALFNFGGAMVAAGQQAAEMRNGKALRST
ncbi:RHS repeat domain-containing protein [Pseudomonas guariconensis]|uniref:RHS repeat domain-containing protein n=1 Tax=Pseudomonas guariconensis TaxID=1288410 RepID=UPI0018ABDE7B|nr:RHS repeat domain-containing protein [Pseudomonas guariconensis]MBF8720529.1 RHS repeat protein [Pseudomonas guariconensis]MBF8792447.1 RHS repeat protein [Pseudomonas monteilii]